VIGSDNKSLQRTPGGNVVRKELLQSALSYYQQYVVDQSDDDQRLVDIAQAEVRIAAIFGLMGDSELSLEHATEAIKLVDKQMSSNEVDSESELSAIRIEALKHQAAALTDLGDTEQAVELITSAIETQQQIVDQSPEDADELNRMAGLYFRSGVLHQRKGQMSESASLLQQCITLRDQLALIADAPAENSLHKQQAIAQLAIAKKNLGKIEEATSLETDMVDELFTLVLEDPEDWEVISSFVTGSLNLAVTHYRSGKPEEMLPLLERADPHAVRLNVLFPADEKYARLRDGIYNLSSAAALRLNQPTEAIKIAKRRVEFLRTRSVQNPGSRGLTQNLAGAIDNLNIMTSQSGDIADDADIQEAVQLAGQIVDEDPSAIQNQLLFCNCLRTAANHYLFIDEAETALDFAKRGIEAIEDIPQNSNDLRTKASRHGLYEISGNVNYKLKNYEAAIANWSRSLEFVTGKHQRQVPRIKISIACAQLHLDDIESAEESISQFDQQVLDASAKKQLAAWYCIRATKAAEPQEKKLYIDKAVAILTSPELESLLRKPSQLKSIRAFSGDWQALQGNPEIEQLISESTAAAGN
jgi:tetratricopeptide (TPR) repeat protein